VTAWDRISACRTPLTSTKPSLRSRKEHPGPVISGRPGRQPSCYHPRNPKTRSATGCPDPVSCCRHRR